MVSQENKDIIKSAICHYVALLDMTSETLFQKLLPFVNLNHLSDSELLSNKRIKKYVDWNAFSNIKMIRLIMRDKSIIDKIDLNKYNFNMKELIPILLFHPDLIDYFELDFSKIGPIEAIHMLEINNNFIDKIDLDKFEFDKLMLNQIVIKFAKCEKIINKLNLKLLDHFSTRSLLVKSGNKHIGKINLKKLKTNDWMVILEKKPELLEYCDMSLFEKGDCFFLTQLAIQFPQLDHLIEKNKNKISALGWEKLLSHQPIIYSKYCDFKILSKKNWDNIVKKQPSLLEKKVKYVL